MKTPNREHKYLNISKTHTCVVIINIDTQIPNNYMNFGSWFPDWFSARYPRCKLDVMLLAADADVKIYTGLAKKGQLHW